MSDLENYSKNVDLVEAIGTKIVELSKEYEPQSVISFGSVVGNLIGHIVARNASIPRYAIHLDLGILSIEPNLVSSQTLLLVILGEDREIEVQAVEAYLLRTCKHLVMTTISSGFKPSKLEDFEISVVTSISQIHLRN
jgi:hypothetical protein